MPEDTAPTSVGPPVVSAVTIPSALGVEADPPANVTRSMSRYLIEFASMVQPMLSSLPGFLWQTVVNLSVSSALALSTGFLCWLIYFRPFNIRPRIQSAVLITFDLTPTSNQLLYDLSLNIAFLNSPGSSAVHFDHLTTGLYYNGTKIGPSDDTLPSFKLDPERRRIVQSVLRGRSSALLVAEAFTREREKGQFNLNVRVRTTLSYWFYPHKGTYYREYDCALQFPPVPGDGTPAVTGGGFKCGIVK